MNQIIQLPDTANSDTELAEFYGWGVTELSAGQFVIIQCSGSERTYLGQIIRPQQNFNRDSLGPYDNQTVNMLERLAQDRLARDVAIKEVFKYTARLLKEVTTGVPHSVRKRPQIGSIGRAAREDEIIQYLGLPEIHPSSQVGAIIDTDIPVCLDRRVLRHHLLFAGGTGSGKTNALANAMTVAQTLGACVIVYDHKPDYQSADEANDEGLELFYRGLSQVSFWYLGQRGMRQDERQITVSASTLNPSVLAHTICHYDTERLAAEALTDLLLAYSESQGDRVWSLPDFVRWLPQTADECQALYNIEIHKETYRVIRGRIRRQERIPTWIDGSVSATSRQFFALDHFELPKLIQPGHVLVVRVDSNAGGGRGYGLFLSYILKEVYSIRERGTSTCPIIHVIDEAQDIFDAGRAFQAAAGVMLDENIRKGRSQNIGFVIGVQSAESVPPDIRNNLNSQFIFRHNNDSQAKEAMSRATRDQLTMTNSFGPGECLAYLFGSNSVVHVQMRRSPFKLTKPDGE